MKEKALVICPGRGTYSKETLGYLKNTHSVSQNFVSQIDQWRKEKNLISISELDNAPGFNPSLHLPGINAASLIYACAYSDFLQINLEKYDLVATMGNSMGWYINLVVAASISPKNGFHLIQTMGTMMQENMIGGQLIYQVVNEFWQRDLEKEKLVEDLMVEVNSQEDHSIYHSINLGGYRVLAGNDKGIRSMLKMLPPQDIYPFKLMGHGAFHTKLMQDISQKSFSLISEEIFSSPQIPLIDGRGVIWPDYATDKVKLREYTLNHQVTCTYDFSLSLKVALKEFAPTKLILLGPGFNLGGAIAQVLIDLKWQNISNKKEFQERQKSDPFLLAMGHPEQRKIVYS